MKFDYAIGNPPYNTDFSSSGDNGNFAAPVYNLFMDAAYTVADKVELMSIWTSTIAIIWILMRPTVKTPPLSPKW